MACQTLASGDMKIGLHIQLNLGSNLVNGRNPGGNSEVAGPEM